MRREVPREERPGIQFLGKLLGRLFSLALICFAISGTWVVYSSYVGTQVWNAGGFSLCVYFRELAG